MKRKPLYQWILRDHQESSFARFEMTSTYHATAEDVNKHYPYLQECRSVVKKYLPSKISVPWMIDRVLEIQYDKKASKKRERNGL